MLTRLLPIAILIAALAPGAFAQRSGNRNGGMMGSQGMGQMNRLDMLSQILGLNKDQKKDVKSIMDEGQKEAAPLREQMPQARGLVAAAIAGGKSQDEVAQAVKDCADLEARMAAIEIKAFSRIFKGLDSSQQQKTRTVFVMMSGIFANKNWMEPE